MTDPQALARATRAEQEAARAQSIAAFWQRAVEAVHPDALLSGERIRAGWAEIKAERLARERNQMAPWVPKIEETEDNG